MLERLLFRKVELWLVILLLLIGLFVMLAFGWGVHHTLRGGDRLGRFGDTLVDMATLPSKFDAILDTVAGDPYSYLLAGSQRFEGESGLKFNYEPGARPDLGYVLINRFDGDAGQSVSELVDLNTQDLVHTWSFDVDATWARSDFESELIDVAVDRKRDRFRNIAIVTADGSIVASYNTPLLRFDHCSRLIWAQPVDMFHHATTVDHEGNYWVSTTIEPKTVKLGVPWTFRDDAITQVSPDGEVLFQKSVVQILDDAGLAAYVYGSGFYHADPIHLNDVQPVLEDGEIWKRGDVLLSIRNRSMILLYRPSTDEVLWHRIGPWIHQHDVDVVDDRRISVFDNHARLRGQEDLVVYTTNNLVVVDVVTGEVTRPFDAGFRKHNVRTSTEGLADWANDDELFVEESNFGRLIQFNREGDVLWSFVNRADSGLIYQMSWSRLVPREIGDSIREVIAKEPCDG